MLTREENELLCRVGPGTPMGAMLRRYWIPACLSEELPERDGPPKRLRLLGEDLIAFRDSEGRVGVFDESCPHRGASLRLARNELGGLRCLYHGWKFDVTGRCLEMPAEPAGSAFRDRVKAIAYPVRERADLVWVYMGPPERTPPFPEFEWVAADGEHRWITKIEEECNFIQAMEGSIDSAHASILHGSEIRPTAQGADYSPGAATIQRPSEDSAPTLEVENTDFGFYYAALRMPMNDPENSLFVRIVPFIAPFYTLIPPVYPLIFVPLDDHHTAWYTVLHDPARPVAPLLEGHKALFGFEIGKDLDEGYRMFRNGGNGWLQDRSAMKNGSFTGLTGVSIQDAVVQESMGPIIDRTREHLGATDAAVIRMRRLMIDSARRVQEGGEPLGLDKPVDYAGIRSAVATISKGTHWLSLVSDRPARQKQAKPE